MRRWLLPEYIEDILPPEALRIERVRRRVLDLFRTHGYELVCPPLLEYVESLLTGTGHDLDLRTFKLVDQLSGRTLGIRADMTPQVARIDAHLLNRKGIARLCYAGSVLHAQPAAMMRSREPLQIGAEIYGHSGIESDVEIQALLVSGLQAANVSDLHLDLGHVAVFRALMQQGSVPPELEGELFQVLQTKDVSTLRELLAHLEPTLQQALLLLPELYGDQTVLDEARRRLPPHPRIASALDELGRIAHELQGLVQVHCFDLAELRGYHYHSGVVFAAYTKGRPNALALGGRYDEVGKAFGRARPATGFTIDLRGLAELAPAAEPARAILAPYQPTDRALRARIDELRKAGEVVIVDLPGHEDTTPELGCDRRLVKQATGWQLVAIDP